MAAFLSLLVSLLLSTALAHDVEQLNSHQARQAMKSKMWYWPGDCSDRIEPCLGTFVWCSMRQYYVDDGYDDQNACFSIREFRIIREWMYINTNCQADFEHCDGTDAVCSRISDSNYRDYCYNAHHQARYLEPFSEGCLNARNDDDERCVGTEEFCKAQKRISSYGSTQACLAYRDTPAPGSKTIEKKPFLMEDPLTCTGDPTEKCLGTEKFCGRLNGQQRQECLASHESPPYYNPSSADCGTSREKGLYSEPCVGTDIWCTSEDRKTLYGSWDACKKFRKAPEKGKGKWIFADYTCLANPNGTEQCEGTEQFCLSRSGIPKSCFATREKPIFYPPGSEGCPGPEIEDERCMGTETWCRLKQHMYDGLGIECLDHRELPTKLASFGLYSPECRGSAELDKEACRGTEQWCKDSERISTYGSEERCRSYRGDLPERSAWLYGEPDSGCSDETEQCLGTYRACSLFNTDELRQNCLAGRNPPGELSDLDDCRHHGVAEEHCTQIIDQCYTQYEQTGYASVTDCLNSGGLDLQQLNSTMFEELAGTVKDVIVEFGGKVVEYAALQHLYYEKGTDESTKAAAKSALASYMGKMEVECDQAVDSAMKSLESR